MPTRQIDQLTSLLAEIGPVKVAVSGGVDSATLGLLAGRALGQDALICHAISPAVPAEATERVKQLAQQENWQLQLINAGEFDNADYLSNPYDRCFHCKSSLYSSLADIGPGTIISGANKDDLNDYRPGLKAAEQHRVRHPFVECGLDKTTIRRIAHYFGFTDLAELPASPCLSSRIETGLPILADQLGFVHKVERRLQQQLKPEVVRCRIKPDQVVIQLDPNSLKRLNGDQQIWQKLVMEMAIEQNMPQSIHFEPYRMGSAFVPPAK